MNAPQSVLPAPPVAGPRVAHWNNHPKSQALLLRLFHTSKGAPLKVRP